MCVTVVSRNLQTTLKKSVTPQTSILRPLESLYRCYWGNETAWGSAEDHPKTLPNHTLRTLFSQRTVSSVLGGTRENPFKSVCFEKPASKWTESLPLNCKTQLSICTASKTGATKFQPPNFSRLPIPNCNFLQSKRRSITSVKCHEEYFFAPWVSWIVERIKRYRITQIGNRPPDGQRFIQLESEVWSASTSLRCDYCSGTLVSLIRSLFRNSRTEQKAWFLLPIKVFCDA